MHGSGCKHCLCLHPPLPSVTCFLQAGFLKFAVGPPTSCIYPLKSGKVVIYLASSIIDSWLLLCTALPWWNVIAQKEQLPKHPLELTILNLTSSNAGIPPASS